MKRYKSLLEFKQVGVLYHFTNIQNLENIIKDNYILKSGSRLKINNKRFPFISFTRDFNLKTGFMIGNQVRISINGDKLSNNYKIQPYSDFKGIEYKKEREEIIIIDQLPIKKYIKQIDIKMNEIDFKNFYNQKYEIIKKQLIPINFVNKWEIVK